jgi:uncharacterized membrane protein
VRRFFKDQRGAVSIIAAAFSGVMLVLAALAVDVGYLFLQSRKLQGTADLAAMAAASDLPRAEAAAAATAQANGWAPDVRVKVERGMHRADPAIPVKQRFAAGAPAPNAARVTLETDAQLFFGRAILGDAPVRLRRTATAARPELAAFSIGSRLAALQGGAANALLSALAGGQIELSVMDYRALADARVDLLAFSRALASEVNLTAASFDDALDVDVTTPQALRALAASLDATGNAAAAAAARKAAKTADPARKLSLGRLMDLGPFGVQDYATSAKVNVAAQDLMSAILTLAAEGRQVKLDLGAGVPGLADVDVWLAIGERPNNAPWLAVSGDGDPIIRTAQMRLYLEAKVAAAGLAQIRLPVFIEAAAAEARLSKVDCQTGEVALQVKPSLGGAAIGDVDVTKLNDFKHPLTVAPAQIVSLPLVKATGRAALQLGGLTWQDVRFSAADIEAGRTRTVSTHDLTRGLVASLISDLDLDVDVLGLGLGVGPIVNTLGATLAPIAAPLDGLLEVVSQLTGVRLGQADVQVQGTRCGAAALVA